MGREIKFRGFIKENKEMIFFDIMKLATSRNDLWWKCILDGLIIMQFTGLLDDNEKEIYEGDIISIAENEDMSFSGGEVVFDTDLSAFVIYNNNGSWRYLNSLRFMQVVGNIHENKDLLKESK